MINNHSLITFHGDLVDYFEKNMRGRDSVLCPSCGHDYGTYVQTGRLGCSKCYDVFRDQIVRQIKSRGA